MVKATLLVLSMISLLAVPAFLAPEAKASTLVVPQAALATSVDHDHTLAVPRNIKLPVKHTVTPIKVEVKKMECSVERLTNGSIITYCDANPNK